MYYLRNTQGLMVAKVSKDIAQEWIEQFKFQEQTKFLKSTGKTKVFVFNGEDALIGASFIQILIQPGYFLYPA